VAADAFPAKLSQIPLQGSFHEGFRQPSLQTEGDLHMRHHGHSRFKELPLVSASRRTGVFERCPGASSDMKQVFAGKHCQLPAGQSMARSI